MTFAAYNPITDPQPRKFGGRCVILSNLHASACITITLALVFISGLPATAGACGGPVAGYRISEDLTIEQPLCGLTGAPERGREIAAGRKGNCLACHRMPIPEEKFHGDIGPPLFDTGRNMTAGELRLRLVDSTAINPDSVMPSFHRIDHLSGVRSDRRGQPILSAQQVEDVIAWLLTLDGETPAR